ncbi:zinc finger, CCHC-type containing protein [Tanacetum coccineum]
MENLYPKHGLVSFHLKCKIDLVAGGKLCNKNAHESWEIIENLSLYDHEGPSPQPQALGTTFEAQIRDYMAAHSERMERFENAIFKQCVEINGRMTEMFGLLKELTTNRAPKKDRVGKVKGKTYNVSPRGPIYEAILKKKITKKEDIGGNFAIPCSIGGLKYVNALVDQGSNVNVMPYSTYMKLIDERPAETNIRLLLASHSYIYPLGIAEDVLVEVVEHVYLVDFVILDIKENEKWPFILGTTFLTTAKATIKFDKGTITLRSGKNKASFHRIPAPSCITDKGEREMKFNQWRSKSFKDKRPTLIETKEEMDDEGEVRLYLMRRSLEVLRKFPWMILG